MSNDSASQSWEGSPTKHVKSIHKDPDFPVLERVGDIGDKSQRSGGWPVNHRETKQGICGTVVVKSGILWEICSETRFMEPVLLWNLVGQSHAVLFRKNFWIRSDFLKLSQTSSETWANSAGSYGGW